MLPKRGGGNSMIVQLFICNSRELVAARKSGKGQPVPRPPDATSLKKKFLEKSYVIYQSIGMHKSHKINIARTNGTLFNSVCYYEYMLFVNEAITTCMSLGS